MIDFRRALESGSHIIPSGAPLSVQIGTTGIGTQVTAEGTVYRTAIRR